MAASNLTDLSAIQARKLLDNGEISAINLIEACIAQVQRVNPVVNSMCTTAFDRARAEAVEADKRLGSGQSSGVLEGIPVAIKDNQMTAGIRTTRGSKLYQHDIPDQDAGIVARIRAAGGIVLGKTNIPELSIGANTVNPLFGATKNPFDTRLTCGGSSGGSAVTVATHMTPLATGSDHGGSLRIPASYCGVVGYRATPGVVPNEERAISQTNYSVQGPIARTVADAALLLSVITQRSASSLRDPMAFPLDAAQFRQQGPVDPATLRVALTEDLGGVLVSNSNRQLFRDKLGQVATRFRQCDWHNIDISQAPDVDWHLRQDVFATQYVEQAGDWPDGMNPNVLATYNKAIETNLAEIAKARRQQMQLYHRMLRVFDDYDVLILPGMSIPPFPWTQLNPEEIDGKPVVNYMAWLALTSSLTVVGHPVVSLPCGLDHQGTPFGIQIVGRPFNDSALLQMAGGIEQMLADVPGLGRPVADLANISEA